MALADNGAIIKVVQSGLQSPFWREYLLPLLQDCARTRMEALLTGKSDDDERTKGFVNGLRFVIGKPQADLDVALRTERDAQQQQEIERDDDHRAAFGFRSPYKLAPTPGETKLADVEPPTAHVAGE